MKKINEQKLQAFAIGTMGKRPLSKKEQEDRRKREDETAAAHAFKEFVETFQETPSTSKVWVKAGTYDAGSRREDSRDKGKLYKPITKAAAAEAEKSSADKALEYAQSLATEAKAMAAAGKKKTQEKKKSNLELFKEELRQIQEERQERTKYKSIAKSIMTHSTAEPEFPMLRETEFGSMDNGDPNTTNIYLGNLNPKITEQQLMELFGRYGPLASIKIMWPRSEEEKSRGRNCGFVAFMSRTDAERALKCLNGRDVMNYEMKLGWGKSVTIMNHPIYIPPALVEYVMPPPPSGLPFNAQPQPIASDQFPPKEYFHNYHCDEQVKRDMEELSYKCIVKVMIPTERPLLALVHRMIEFVVREGPMFEAMIMSREIDNPIFRFLFENESPAHIYYRWKLFSLLQGDTPAEWRQQEFRMFKGGAIWKPPAAAFYTQGMPEELIVDEDAPEVNKGTLSNAQRDRLEELIHQLTPERSKIADAMIFCIDHADAADEICDCIEESLANARTQPSRKIARLYLISDLLHNCTVKVSNASFYRRSLERHLEQIFANLHASYAALESRLKAEGFKLRVLQVCRAWEEWTVYHRDFLTQLKNTFLGKGAAAAATDTRQNTSGGGGGAGSDVDGQPMSGDEKDDEDLDGVPLDGAALLKSALMRGIPSASSSSSTASPAHRQALAVAEKLNRMAPRGVLEVNATVAADDNNSDYDDDDIDGVPVGAADDDDDIDGTPMVATSAKAAGGFMPSKWETVDPDQVEAQAITTSKWDTLDPVAPAPPSLSGLSEYGQVAAASAADDPASKRSRLREIELKTVQYQDELESGERALKSGWTISEQTEHYRRKLIRKDGEANVDSPVNALASEKSEKLVQQQQQQQLARRLVEYDAKRRSVSPAASTTSSSAAAASASVTSRKSTSSKTSKSKRSPSPSFTSSSSKRRSRSPHASSRSRYSARDSPSPPPVSRSSKLKRAQSRSPSMDDSPIRASDRRADRGRSRSVSPAARRYRSRSPPPARSTSRRDASPPPSSSSSSRHRTSDKHSTSSSSSSSRHSKYSKY